MYYDKKPPIQKYVDKYNQFVKENNPTSIRHRSKGDYGSVMDRISWCKKCIGKEYDTWAYFRGNFEFKSEDDLVMFKLAWCYDNKS